MVITTLTDEDRADSLPDVSSAFRIDCLDGTVEVHRDSYGIPHVRADTIHNAFHGQGFVTAQDRFWHMDNDRCNAYGTLAELVGELSVEQDVKMRKFQILSCVESD